MMKMSGGHEDDEKKIKEELKSLEFRLSVVGEKSKKYMMMQGSDEGRKMSKQATDKKKKNTYNRQNKKKKQKSLDDFCMSKVDREAVTSAKQKLKVTSTLNFNEKANDATDNTPATRFSDGQVGTSPLDIASPMTPFSPHVIQIHATNRLYVNPSHHSSLTPNPSDHDSRVLVSIPEIIAFRGEDKKEYIHLYVNV
ncbi:hypothetical protein RFI_18188 [Reticulomyxa filosa]|uniref:Uncharacterized protein n=1 Tax=Reticulomyxa filosa TaxID=46433 RepID=X6N146_RETFI|nr:hypothetical protein RFI_18188 [Reticulomyxa filosa]|eukprot:ETO19052.1 hypothetical protein RFI_18188 [Reticulomyxa filosa]